MFKTSISWDRIKRRWPTVTIIAGILLCLSVVEGFGAEDATRRGSRLFFRIVGAQNNAPILPKSRSAWTQDRQLTTGTTGSSDHGFTEYPFCWGRMDFTFVEGHAIYPRLISDAVADPKAVNTADIVIDHVYQPHGCVWGWAAREFIQTFTASQSELVSLTLLVASEPGTFIATLLEGGPGGRQIGPAKSFDSGHSMTWGHVRWPAGQAPLQPGRTYGIRIVRVDGKPWTPYLHSTGNAYDDGLVYVDGTPRPESDLATWIVEEPPELKRALIHGANQEGWAFRQTSVSFTPRTPNVRLISLTLSPVTEEDQRDGYCDMVIRVHSEVDGQVLTRKRCLSTGPKGGAQTAHFLFATDELPIEPATRYWLDAYLIPHKQQSLPEEEDPLIVPRDMRPWVYGEPFPGQMPAIYNLSLAYASNSGFMHDSRLTFRWSEPVPCPTVIETWGDGVNDGIRTLAAPGETSVQILKFWPGHKYQFRLTSTGPTGLRWKTPLYEIRIPRGTEIGPIRQEEYPEQFVTLAPPQHAAPPRYDSIRYREQVDVTNGDFEDGLTGWKIAGDEEIETSPSKPNLGVKWGRAMAGWYHTTDRDRQQALAKATLSQTIATKPGHTYVLSAWARTCVEGGSAGNTRVRLFADPDGGDDFGDRNSSQWYWAEGRWMRFEHRWVASSEQSTIGLGLFRWYDVDLATAHVDFVTVYDLGPVALGSQDATTPLNSPPTFALVEPSTEANDKVEASLQAPPGHVITGIGARAQDDNITTMWLRVQPLLADGTMGTPEYLRGGWEPDAGLEAQVELPPGYVATGFGAAIAPEWDVKRFRVWGRPLAADGSLGEEKEFRGGADLESGVERQVNLPAGRVLTSAGLNCMHNDINGIKAQSAVLVRTATGSKGQ
ncbi:MAG: hypothetical protein H8E44_25645 [Planctomycetes bacterium]|nr:hypothetical protein [Planctomycetota bacterium]MBL7038329.1 hypothetical protein [Pirellulaceae bacterium]